MASPRRPLAGALELFDGVLLHSSLEHSGLGRYGDVLNPWGDVLAVAWARCDTKADGFLYKGVLTGQSLCFSNGHRLYGQIRWPLLTADWRCLDGNQGGDELDRMLGEAVRWNGVRTGWWGYLFRIHDTYKRAFSDDDKLRVTPTSPHRQSSRLASFFNPNLRLEANSPPAKPYSFGVSCTTNGPEMRACVFAFGPSSATSPTQISVRRHRVDCC